MSQSWIGIIEPHRPAVLVDAVLAERRELDDEVEAGEQLLSQAGEHVFVKLGEGPDGRPAAATYLAITQISWSTSGH